MADPGIGYLFKVEVDGLQLGVFTKIDGLGAKYETQTVQEGGENNFVHHLPGRVTYDNIRLTRPVDKDSSKLAAWFTSLQENVQSSTRTPRRTASVTAYGPDTKPLVTWNLTAVYPVSYKGPTLQAGQAQVLTETIELAHNGFWSDASPSAGMPTPPSAEIGASATAAASQVLSAAGSAGLSLDIGGLL